MRIIFKADKEAVLKCVGCGSILAISRKDLQFSQFHVNLVFTCPVCEVKNAVDASIAVRLGAGQMAHDNLERIGGKKDPPIPHS